MDLCTCIYQLRKLSMLRRQDAAAALNVSVSTLKRWEKTEPPYDVQKLKAIAAFYGVTEEQLREGKVLSIPADCPARILYAELEEKRAEAAAAKAEEAQTPKEPSEADPTRETPQEIPKNADVPLKKREKRECRHPLLRTALISAGVILTVYGLFFGSLFAVVFPIMDSNMAPSEQAMVIVTADFYYFLVGSCALFVALCVTIHAVKLLIKKIKNRRNKS